MKAFLKKGLVLCMACMLVLGMTACGGDSNATTSAKTEASSGASAGESKAEEKTTEKTTEEESSTKK